jgi:hypothetical protein
MPVNFIIITDSDFFKPTLANVRQINNIYPKSTIFIYDWGLEDPQYNQLNSESNTELISWRVEYDCGKLEDILINLQDSLKSNKVLNYAIDDFLGIGFPQLQQKQEYLYCQKPFCIIDCIDRTEGDLIYMDGDAVLVNSIDEILQDSFDIAVTVRPKMEFRKGWSPLNAGVIFFSTRTNKSELFVNKWIELMNDMDGELVEQSSIWELINQSINYELSHHYQTGSINIGNEKIITKVLPCKKYNYYWVHNGFNIENNKILHFKGRGFDEPELAQVIDKLIENNYENTLW